MKERKNVNKDWKAVVSFLEKEKKRIEAPRIPVLNEVQRRPKANF